MNFTIDKNDAQVTQKAQILTSSCTQAICGKLPSVRECCKQTDNGSLQPAGKRWMQVRHICKKQHEKTTTLGKM